VQLSWQFNRQYKWRTAVRVWWSVSCMFRCENSSMKFNHRVQHRSLAKIKPAFPKCTTLLKTKFLLAISIAENSRVQNLQLGSPKLMKINKVVLIKKFIFLYPCLLIHYYGNFALSLSLPITLLPKNILFEKSAKHITISKRYIVIKKKLKYFTRKKNKIDARVEYIGQTSEQFSARDARSRKIPDMFSRGDVFRKASPRSTTASTDIEGYHI